MKNLTIYYSEKGMTKAVAEKIAGMAGTDLFEIAEENPKRNLFGRVGGKSRALKPLPEEPERYGHFILCLPIKSSGRVPTLSWAFAQQYRGRLAQVSYVFVKRGSVKDMPQRIVELDEMLDCTFERAAFIDPTDPQLDERLKQFLDGLDL